MVFRPTGEHPQAARGIKPDQVEQIGGEFSDTVKNRIGMGMPVDDSPPYPGILSRQVREPARDALLRLIGRKGCWICYKTGGQRSGIRGACTR
ncbi:hypothetical protein BN961_01855 [Afipia felis]|uniref:Uncharacterized protein n=1 Tax=Afipia felis TaxID=1035 RepID=A0A090MM03_AFIFE|nr:hypothetical protein BN961_01855 [Afipia felis]